MDIDPVASQSFVASVDCLYAGLMRCACDPELGLGGRLVYGGELDGAGAALVAAANIAGTATLAVTANQEEQKRAIRDGVADFLVTSMDEALRILKNEIRKRQTVAVCVAIAPEAAEREMRERGVLPDLLSPDSPDSSQFDAARFEPFLRLGARQVIPELPGPETAVLTWSVAAAPGRWLPKLDRLAAECLRSDESAARRWLRLAPRYLGRSAQGTRLIRCRAESAREFLLRVEERVARREIDAAVESGLSVGEDSWQQSFKPPVESGTATSQAGTAPLQSGSKVP